MTDGQAVRILQAELPSTHSNSTGSVARLPHKAGGSVTALPMLKFTKNPELGSLASAVNR